MGTPVQITERQATYQNTDASTAETVQDMCGHIRAALQDFVVLRIAADLGGGSRREIAVAVWTWLKRNVRFVEDEEQLWRQLGRRDELELLISPSVLVRAQDKQGDCDDFTMTACALLAARGVPPVIKTFKCSAREPWRWSHVCAGAVLEDGSVFPLDASHGEYPGWEVPARDVYQSQLWDMTGKPVGANNMRRGMGRYVSEPSWTGNPMTTVDGPAAGPYPGGDVMRYWHPGPRARGLAGIARSKYGMGDCSPAGFDEYGDACLYVAPEILNDPVTAAGIRNYINNSNVGTANLPTVTSTGAPINWTAILSQALGSGAALTRQAIATPGTTILPNGMVVTGTPQGTSAFNFGGMSSTALLIGALVLGGVVLMVAAKK